MKKYEDMDKAQIMRLFSQKKKKYDVLINKLRSLQEITASDSSFVCCSGNFDDVTEIDIEQADITPRRRGARKVSNVFTLDKFYAPPASSLLKHTKDFVEAEESLREIEGMYAALSAKANTSFLTGTNLSRRLKGLDFSKLSKIDGVFTGQDAVKTTPDSLIILFKKGADKKAVASKVRNFLKEMIKNDARNLNITGKYVTVGKNDGIAVRFAEGDKPDAATSKFLNSMMTYKKNLEKVLEEAEENIFAMAEDHVPESVRSLSKAAVEHINDTLDSSLYDEINESLYVSVSDKSSLYTFTSYIEISGIKNTEKTSRFIIVITSRIREHDKGYELKSFLTYIKDFEKPGDFPVGEELSVSEMSSKNKAHFKRKITYLLSLSGISFALQRMKLNIVKSEFTHSGINKIPGVLASRLSEDKVVLVCSNIDDRIIEEEILGPAILILRKLMRSGLKRDRSVFAHKIAKTSSGKKMLVIARVPNN